MHGIVEGVWICLDSEKKKKKCNKTAKSFVSVNCESNLFMTGWLMTVLRDLSVI